MEISQIVRQKLSGSYIYNMIKIVEIHPAKKLSGYSSLLISFNYNPIIVDIIKELPVKIYDKKTFEWEIPVSSLAAILDRLTVIDDIELKLLPDKDISENKDLTDAEISKFKFTPFAHQISGINYGLNTDKWLLLDSMGLGKSLQLIGLAETLKRRGKIDHCLIICGIASLRQNWKREIQKFSTEDVLVLGEKISKSGRIYYSSIKDRVDILKNEIKEFFVVCNIETLRSDEVITALQKSKNNFGMIAVDEIHKCATKQAAQSANLLKLKADYKVGATGTLITNSPLSCYVPLSWTENDKATLTNFKSQYCQYGGFSGHEIIGYKDLDLLKDEIDSCSIRRTLEEVRQDMPGKQLRTEIVELDDEHSKFYESIKEGVKSEALKIELNSSNLLALTTRLRQATADPGILTTEKIMSTKLERCVELTEELISQNEKVVIFGNFKEPVYHLAELLKEYNPLICTGDQSEDDIARSVELFQNNENYKIILATHSKMGTGWTLNSAKYMICIDTPYTWSSFSQSTDRIWRITNKYPAFITTLIAANTIDERVQQIIDTKKELGDYLVDGKLSDGLARELKSILLDL